MKRIGKRILLVGAICAGMYNSTYCLMGMKKNTSPETAFESGVSANNVLSTILVNADLLLQQINNNAYDKDESYKYLKEINGAQAKLSSDLHNAVKPHISVIEQEFKKYSKLSEPNRKNYDQSAIKQAFKQLRRVIKNAANNTAESVVTSAHETIQRAIAHAEKVTTRATAEINTIRMQLSNGEIAPVEAAKKIGEQQYIIMSAEQELKKITEQAQKNVESSDAQASYLSKFAKGAYGLGQTALTQTQLKLGLDHTQEEKDIARAVISQLEEQMAIATVKYKESMRRTDLTIEQKAQLDALYNQTMEELNSERYQQQLITGDVMNFNRKLFWGAVAAAGAAGAYLGYQYLTQEGEKPLSTTEQLWKKVQTDIMPGVTDWAEKTTGMEPLPGERSFDQDISEGQRLKAVLEGGLQKAGEGIQTAGQAIEPFVPEKAKVWTEKTMGVEPLPEFEPSEQEREAIGEAFGKGIQTIGQKVEPYVSEDVKAWTEKTTGPGELPEYEPSQEEKESLTEAFGNILQQEEPVEAVRPIQGKIHASQLDPFTGMTIKPQQRNVEEAVRTSRVLGPEDLPEEKTAREYREEGKKLKEGLEEKIQTIGQKVRPLVPAKVRTWAERTTGPDELSEYRASEEDVAALNEAAGQRIQKAGQKIRPVK